MAKQEFNDLIDKSTNINEVSLFRCMSDYFNAQSNIETAFFEVHQHKGFIDYHSEFTNLIKKIEIADLLIINYNVAKNETRICFVQAKYKREHLFNINFFPCRGNGFQWELLRRRCDIIDAYHKGFPQNILNFNREYLAITSFGIFYHDGNNKINFLYSIPERFSIASPRKETTLYYTGDILCPSHYCLTLSCVRETPFVETIDGFESALTEGNIGAPIIKNTMIEQYIHNSLIAFSKITSNQLLYKIFNAININIENPAAETVPINTLVVYSGDKEHNS